MQVSFNQMYRMTSFGMFLFDLYVMFIPALFHIQKIHFQYLHENKVFKLNFNHHGTEIYFKSKTDRYLDLIMFLS